jgi:hypothetical protein
MRYLLCRIEDDGTRTEVSKHDTAYGGIVEGARITEYVDCDYAYALHNNGYRVAIFHEGRIGYREWAIRTGRLQGECIHSLDDRYDHDVDVALSK